MIQILRNWLLNSVTEVRIYQKFKKLKLLNFFFFEFYLVSVNYWILDTDYTSYTLVYSCINFLSFPFRFGIKNSLLKLLLNKILWMLYRYKFFQNMRGFWLAIQLSIRRRYKILQIFYHQLVAIHFFLRKPTKKIVNMINISERMK